MSWLAPNVMVNRSGEGNAGAVSLAAPPARVPRSPKAVDFEKLLSDLSASFIRVPAEEVDGEIERWLQLIVLAMDIDRSTVAQVDPADGLIYTTHQWAREGLPAPERGKRRSTTGLIPGSQARYSRARLW